MHVYMKLRICDYIVECGNWKVKVALYENEFDGDDAYIEACTRAVEGVFGLRNFNMHCELMSLRALDGRDYFDVENIMMVNMPQPMFSVIMCVYKASDVLTYTRWRLYLSSYVFANASQYINLDLALHAETLESDKVRMFHKMVNQQKKTIKKRKKN